MKIYLSNLNESWIVDRLRNEWIESNKELVVKNPKDCEIIWIISPWTWKKINKKYLRKKFVVCTIHHLEDSDFTEKGKKEFYKRDKFVNVYHTISENSLMQLRKLTNKKIVKIPFWVNENIFYEIKDKNKLREKYGFSKKEFLLGSFQRDTEGRDLISPKLIKGPDRFVEIAKTIRNSQKDLLIILAGKRREYVISQLEELNINYRYFEMVNLDQLNELYNCLDLYIVSSRIEGGPQAIVECAITKTNVISTDVGIAKEILHEESIFNMRNYELAIPNTNEAYKNIQKLTREKGQTAFNEFFKLLYENNILKSTQNF